MANIESLDRIFSAFSSTAKNVRGIKKSRLENINKILDVFDELLQNGQIPSEFAPKNNKRLADNIIVLLPQSDAATIAQAALAIKQFIQSQVGQFPTSVSLFEISLVALARASLLGPNRRPYFMSAELLTLYPEMSKYSRRVKI